MAIDVTEATFQTAVIDRSHQVPVVVDFWAEWCGPCRQLGPLLERAAADRAGKVDLAKVDTDANQQLARAFRIQGIPAVKAFSDGVVVSEFVGAQSREVLERFFDSLLPSEADALVAVGDERALRRALELEPTRADAAVPLARMLHARGESDEALQILGRVPGSFTADGVAARIRLEAAEASALGSSPELQGAFEALDAGDNERALELLLGALPEADGSKDDVRRVVVGVLDELGPDNELARTSRRRLAAALY